MMELIRNWLYGTKQVVDDPILAEPIITKDYTKELQAKDEKIKDLTMTNSQMFREIFTVNETNGKLIIENQKLKTEKDQLEKFVKQLVEKSGAE